MMLIRDIKGIVQKGGNYALHRFDSFGGKNDDSESKSQQKDEENKDADCSDDSSVQA
jgi:hypothetical protein